MYKLSPRSPEFLSISPAEIRTEYYLFLLQSRLEDAVKRNVEIHSVEDLLEQPVTHDEWIKAQEERAEKEVQERKREEQAGKKTTALERFKMMKRHA